MNIEQMICVINEVNDVKDPERNFNKIVLQVSEFLQRLGFNLENIQFIPIPDSGKEGGNIVSRCREHEKDSMPWY